MYHNKQRIATTPPIRLTVPLHEQGWSVSRHDAQDTAVEEMCPQRTQYPPVNPNTRVLSFYPTPLRPPHADSRRSRVVAMRDDFPRRLCRLGHMIEHNCSSHRYRYRIHCRHYRACGALRRSHGRSQSLIK